MPDHPSSGRWRKGPDAPSDRNHKYPYMGSCWIGFYAVLFAFAFGFGIIAISITRQAPAKSTHLSTCKPDFVMIKDAFGKMACVRGYNVGSAD